MISLTAPSRRSRLLAAFVALGLVASGSLLEAVPAYAAPMSITVTSTTDVDHTATCATVSALDSPVTLRTALCYANQQTNPVTITLTNPTYQLAYGPLLIGTKSGADITVRAGAGVTPNIIGNGLLQVMTLDPFADGSKPVGNVTVSLTGLTIRGGVDNLYGGGGISGGSYFPDVAKDTLTITDTTITGNRANTTPDGPTWNPGGGIQFMGGSLNIVNSTISNNSSGSSPGGGVAYQGVGIAGEGLTITDSTFSGNSSASTDSSANGGGALAVDDVGGLATMAISGTTFSGNSVTGGVHEAVGSAIWQRSGTLSLNKSTISGNSITGSAGAGAVQIDGGAFTAHYNRIIGNTGSAGLASAATSALTINAKNNWWGCVAGPDAPCNAVKLATGTVASIASPYLTLTAAAATTPLIHPAKTTAVTASMLTNSAGTAILPTDLSAFAGAPVTWGNALPSGATITPNLTTLVNGTTSATFNAATTEGPGSVRANLDGAVATANLEIRTQPAITSGASANAVVGAATTLNLVTTTGFPKPGITFTGDLPDGVAITDAGTGIATLTGTPAAGEGGDYPITVKADNGVGTAPTKNVTVHVAEAPGIGSAASTSFTVGQSGSFTVTTGGFPVVSAIGTSGALPSGVTFTTHADGTGTLSGTPDAGTGGTYPLTFTANNGTNPSATQNFVLTVIEPVSISTQPTAVRAVAGDTASFTAAATGFPAPTVKWQVSTDAGATFTDVPGATAATLSFATTQSDNGNRYRAVFANGTTATTSAVKLTVGTPPAITTAASGTFTVDGTSQTFDVTSTGTPAAALTVTGAPAWLTLVDAGDGTAVLKGKPPVGSGTASLPLTITAANGFGTAATQSFTLTITEAPRFTSAAQATFAVGTSSPFTVTTSGSPTVGSVAQTGTLPTGMTFTDNLDGTATIDGTPAVGQGGEYELTFTVDNGIAPNAVQTFALTVTEAPLITTNPADAAQIVGAPVSFTAAAGGFPVPTVQWQVATDAGGAFSDLAGKTSRTLTFTAAQAQDGHRYRAVFRSDSGVATTTEASLAVGTVPEITSAAAATFALNGGGQFFTFEASGVPAARFSLGGSVPAWLTLTDPGNGTASLAGTPPAGSSGSHTFNVQASNRFGDAATQSFTLTVSAAPLITSSPSATFAVGSTDTFTVTTTPGFPSTTVIAMSGVLPEGLTFDDLGDGTATVTGKPVVAAGKSYPLTFTASNTAGSTTQPFTLVVNEPSTFTTGTSAAFTVGTPGSFTVKTGGGYPAVGSITAVSTGAALPTDLTLDDNGDGTATLSGIAPAGSGGAYTLQLTGVSGVSPDATQTLTVTVTEAAVIVTNPSSTTVTAGGTATFTVAATGYPAPTVKWQASIDGGSHYTDVPGATAATLSFTASQPQNGTLYRAVFSNGTTDATTTPALLTVGTPPAVTSAASATFLVDGSVQTFTATSTGSPSADLALSGDVPNWLSFTDMGDGTATLTGTPPVGSGGDYVMTLTAANTFLPDATQTFTLTVAEAPTITSAADTLFEVGDAASFSIETDAGFPTVTTLGVTGTVPGGLVFTDNGDGTAELAGTPAAGTGGIHTLTVTAGNAGGASVSQTLTVTIEETPHFTSDAAATFTHGITGSVTVKTSGGFPSATSITVAGELPDGLTFTDNGDGTATLQGTTMSAVGAHEVTLTAGNGVGTDATQTFTLTVVAAAAVPLPIVVPESDGSLAGVPGEAKPGQKLTVTADGFAADAPITFGIYSTPRQLATATADASGSATVSLTLPADLVGEHTIVASGLDSAGHPRFVTKTITITQAAVDPGTGPGTDPAGPGGTPSVPGGTSTSPLAGTGVSDGLPLLGMLAVFLLVAGAFVLGRRRRIRS
ncbi:beta strand repeat-containing protein [Leifsonia sp. YAF41]|uniref:beta strand repeat-containing protein n=1 Tax=Leifsonia sp. YAF41 TaxID=3233086 RepID=UPI003F95DFD8